MFSLGIIFNGERLNAFPLTRQGCPNPSFVLEVLTSETRKKKNIYIYIYTHTPTHTHTHTHILKEINPEFIGRSDDETEAPVLWPHDVKS